MAPATYGVRDRRLGGGSTHAWCQIYVPGSGWVEFDPTNGIVGNRDLIRVGVARTPDQARLRQADTAIASPPSRTAGGSPFTLLGL